MKELISFIVPAHNESFEIGRTLNSIFTAARAVNVPFEVIVVNDASTDSTVMIARDAGARVVDVQLRKISAVRNAGAREAKGDVFFFVDADTQVPEATLRAALKALDQGAIGGGAWVDFAGPVSAMARGGSWIFGMMYTKVLRWAAGCFVFARRSAFEAVGGFDEALYASEEITLSRALKKQGRFVVVRERVLTSSRKLRLQSPWSIFAFVGRFLRHGPGMLRRREGMEWWYDGKREKSK